jgi:uncharacterized membrane protein YhaH (DUF805 family)
MLISLNTRLHRHRRLAAVIAAVFVFGVFGFAAHSAMMGSDMGKMGDTAAVCLALGGCAVFIGAAVVAVRRLRQRPLWVIPAPAAPILPFVPASTGFLVRAGPPDLIQVFRL